MTRGIDLTRITIFFTAAVASLAVGQVASRDLSVRLTITLAALPLIAAIGFRLPRNLYYGLIVWVAALGMLRRVVALGSGTAHADILLLIAPIGFGALVLVAAHRGAFTKLTPLANTILVLSLFELASVVNPLQGGLTAGVAGLLFVLTPSLSFWIGRGLVDDATFRRVFRIVAALGIGTAFYGMVQTLAGFPRWDAAWIKDSGYTSLNVGGVIRPFASFASASEYARYTGVAIIVWIGLSIGRRSLVSVTLPVAFLLVALVYESSREVLVTLIATFGLLWAARKGMRLAPAVVLGLSAVVILFVAVKYVAPAPSSPLLAHQVAGLSNPLDPNSSTAVGHGNRVLNGLSDIVSHPLGSGVGAITNAAARFGGVKQTTEYDPGNVSIALGAPGIVLWVTLIALAIPLAYRTAVRRRDGLSFIALGVATLLALHWLNGGEYAVSPLPWLALGWLDARAAGLADEAPPDEA